jgi:hypothetical protein
MPTYIPMASATITLPKEQYRELQDIYSKRHRGSTYRGGHDMDKFLYERFLNNSRSVDQSCSKTLEEIKRENIPDGRNVPRSQIDLMSWNERTDGKQERDSSTGLFV